MDSDTEEPQSWTTVRHCRHGRPLRQGCNGPGKKYYKVNWMDRKEGWVLKLWRHDWPGRRVKRSGVLSCELCEEKDLPAHQWQSLN